MKTYATPSKPVIEKLKEKLSSLDRVAKEAIIILLCMIFALTASAQPTLSSRTPTHKATAVAVDQDLILTFDVNIQIGINGVTKQLAIYRTGGFLEELIPLTSDNISGTVLTVSHEDLLDGQGYYVIMNAGVIADVSTNTSYGGFTHSGDWTFTTEEVVDIPDVNFKAYLVGDNSINTNEDSEIQISEATAFTGAILCHGLSISDLTGIEAFTEITHLYCHNNSLASIDVSFNTKLLTLECSGNGLTSINFGDVSTIANLYANNNSLSAIDLSGISDLENTNLSDNTLTALDVSSNALIYELRCSNNSIGSLDLRQNVDLETFYASDNSLTKLFINNGANTDISSFDITGNAALTCAVVDDAAYSTTNWTSVDVGLTFSDTSCPDYTVDIPDANFKSYLVGNTAINTNADGEIQYSEAEAFTDVINCGSQSISDLTGIEAFVNLTYLHCYGNSISSLDLSALTQLQFLNAYTNPISSLDLSNNTMLGTVSLNNTGISSLNINGLTLLHTLNAVNNQLTTIDLSTNTNLQNLNLTNGQLTSIDLSAVTGLRDIDLSGNDLTSLDVSNNTVLEALDFDYNSITSIDVTGLPNLESLYAIGNGLTSVDLSQNSLLEAFWAGSNDFSSVDVTKNPLLKYLYVSGTSLTSIDISNNPDLENLTLVDNELTSLDISHLSALWRLEVNGNSLTEINVRHLPDLQYIRVHDNDLTSLDLRNGNNSNVHGNNFNISGNASLSCILVSDLDYADTNWTNIDAGMTFTDEYCDLSDIVIIPDANLKTALLANSSINTTDDGEITYSEAQAFTGTIEVINLAIADATGLEAFINMDELNISINDLTELDVSSNTALTSLRIGGNDITSIDVSANTMLTDFIISDCPISSIDISNNTLLTVFSASNNGLTSIDLSNNVEMVNLSIYNQPGLTSLDVSSLVDLRVLTAFNNGITAIDLSNNALLEQVLLENNALTSIDVSSNVELTNLNVARNDLTALDVTSNPDLITLNFYQNDISTIDISNSILIENFIIQETDITSVDLTILPNLRDFRASNTVITTLDFSNSPDLFYLILTNTDLETIDLRNGNNEGITTINLLSNSNLTCVSVDDPAESAANWTNVDDSGVFQFTCDPDEFIDFPDANFKAALLAHDPVVDTNDDGEISYGEAAAVTGLLDIDDNAIADLTGLEYFSNITELTVGDNDFETLDLSNNLNLTRVTVSRVTNLTSFDLGNNEQIDFLIITFSQLTSLDLSSYTSLTYIAIPYNYQLTSVDFTGLTNLDNLSMPFGNLTSIDVSTNTAITNLRVDGHDLSMFDVSNNTILTHLDVSHNNLTEIDISENDELISLRVDSNPITALDVTDKPDLIELNVADTEIATLDVSNNPLMRYFYAQNNTTINEIDARNWNEAIVQNFNITGNTNLNCVSVDDPAFARNNWTEVDDPAVYKFTCDPNDIVNIPDANFKAALLANGTINTVDDGEITYGEADAHTGEIDVSESSIVDLTGIEAFANLQVLKIFDNDITELDITNNILLTDLWAWDNSLTSIDLSNNTELSNYLILNNNNIGSIDLSANTKLRNLQVDNCGLSAGIDVSALTELTTFVVRSNDLTSIDLSNNTLLTDLRVELNNLSSLDLSANTEIRQLRVANNPLTALDVSAQSELTTLYADNTEITDLDISGNTSLHTLSLINGSLNSLNVANGNNSSFVAFTVRFHPDLTCIMVDDVAYAETNWTDPNNEAGFSTDCNVVDIPDENFRNALLTNTSINTNEDDFIQETEAEAYTGGIDVSGQEVSDLTGIGHFTQLTSLNFNDNDVVSVDLTPNLALTSVTGYNNNNLVEFQIGNASSLSSLNLTNGDLSDIDLSSLPALNTLYLVGNTLTELDVSGNTVIAIMGVQNNQLTSLDLSANTNLQWLYAQNNNINSIDLSNNTLLSILYMEGNGLEALDLSNNTALEDLYVGGNDLSLIDLTNNTALVNLDIYTNHLSSIDLTNNTALEFINLNSNDLTALDVSSLVNLDYITACCMDISSIDLSNNTALTNVWLQNNSLTDIDLSMCPLLDKVVIYGNSLMSVNVANGTNEIISDFRAQSNSSLGCITVDDPAYSEDQSSWQKDEATHYSTDCGNIETDITAFSLSEQSSAAVIDLNDHEIYVEVAFGTDLTSLTPTISISDGANVDPASDESQDFSSGFIYTVTAENPSVTQEWMITVLEENLIPTELELSSYSIDEYNELGDVVGTLSTTDPNDADTHTYSLVSGAGDTDNASFTISGNELLAAEAFDFESQSSYAIRIQTDDGRGGTYDNDFAITVNDLDEIVPTITSLSPLDGAVDVALDASLVLTFSEDIMLGVNGATKQVVIQTPFSGNFEVIPLIEDYIDGNVLTIPHMNFDEGQEYSIYLAEGVIADLANNWHEGIVPDTGWNFVTEDNTAPEIVSLSPAAGSDSVPVDSDLVIEFNEDISIGTGDFQLQVYDSQSMITSFEITSENISIDGSLLTIDLPEDMPFATQMYANIFTGGVTDLSGNDFVRGDELDNKAWNWATEKQSQEITFDPISDRVYGDESFELSAAASSGLEVVFSVVSGPVSLDGNTVTITGAGEVEIAADQSGDDNYEAATQVTQSFSISKADQVISITSINDKLTTGDPFDVEASTTSGLALTYTVTGPASVESNTITLDGTAGTVTVTVSQAGDDNYNSTEESTIFEVTEPIAETEDQTITFDAISDKVFGDEPFDLVANATSGLNVSFSVVSGPISLEGSTVTILGTGEVVIAADQDGDESFNAASQVTQSFAISKADQTITFDAIADKTYGDAAFELSGSASSGLALTYSVISGSVTLDGNMATINGGGEVVIGASQAGDNNYNAAVQVTQSFTVNKADQTITITEIGNKTILDDPFEVIATTTSELALAYAVEGPATLDGETLTLDGTEGTVTVTVSQAGNDNFNEAEESVTFEVVFVLGLDQEELSVQVYPNPATEWVRIEGGSHGQMDVSIFDMNGRLAMKESIVQNQALSLQELEAGIYLMTITDDIKTTTTKLMVKR